MLCGLSVMVLLAAGGSTDWLSSAWSFFLLAMGFSLVIFVHEMGHFLAAKWAGVRVEQFAIGFGKELLGFTRGETRYSLNMLPLGGYVKMLGQEDFVVDKSGELKVKDDPRSFTNKSVAKRMVIISAGVIMNLFFAAIAFGIVVRVGRLQAPPVIGAVLETSPAGRAGLQTGDRILAVSGRSIDSFDDFRAEVMLCDQDQPLELDIERDGRLVEPKPKVLPEYRREVSARLIGVQGGMNSRIAIPSLLGGGDPAPNELHRGDVLYKLDVGGGEFKEFKDIGVFRRAVVSARGRPVEMIVNRPKQPKALTEEAALQGDQNVDSEEVKVQVRALWFPVSHDSEDYVTGPLLGLVPRLTVSDVVPEKSFALASVQSGDVIVKIGTSAFPNYATLKRMIEENPNKDIPIEVRRLSAENGGLTGPAVSFCVRHREELIAAAREGPAKAVTLAASLAHVDRLAESDLQAIDAKLKEAGNRSGIRRLLENVDVHKLSPLVPKSPFALFTRSPAPTIDATMHTVDDDGVVVSDVVESTGGRTTPAKQAGIPVGAVILTADGTPVRHWSELTEIFRGKSGQTVELSYRAADEVFSAKLAVPMSITAAMNLAAGDRIVSVDGKSSCQVEVRPGKTVDVSLPDWRAIVGLLKESVGKTVPVEYVTSNGKKMSGQYGVTEENIDPWLERIFYTETFLGYELKERHPVSNPFLAVAIGFKKAYRATAQTVLSIKHMLFTGQVGLDKVSGPVGIFRIGTRVADKGILDLLWFLAIISANLAVLNFLPMPIVDGGLFLFLILEKIRGEPVSIKTQVATQLIGIALIATLFILVTYQDIKNWITGT